MTEGLGPSVFVHPFLVLRELLEFMSTIFVRENKTSQVRCHAVAGQY